MSENDEEPKSAPVKPKKQDGQVSLNQMLRVLDKDVASGVEKKLKKLSKKKVFKAVVNDREVSKLNRKASYNEVVQEVDKWGPIVGFNRRSNLTFPLDVEPDNLPTTANSISNIRPRNDLEREVQRVIDENRAALAKERQRKRTEEQYRKAISAEEAKERHLELQKTRVKLNEYAATMRRQKKIKSKSYHRLLKQERIKKHVKRVESNKDALMDEIERLQKIRAQERATLKHKNTGKWAKHAKFRAKYDEEARKLMLDQIGLANKRLEKPVLPESDSDESVDDSEDDDDVISIESDDLDKGNDDEGSNEGVDVINKEDEKDHSNPTKIDRPIVSGDPIGDGALPKHKSKDGNDIDTNDNDPDNVNSDYENEQRRLMSEAFANDDVVGEFKEAKDKIADEEQPKDIDKYLPGWNDWAGPGIQINESRRQKFIKKAKKVDRKDEALSNVIISERANDSIKELQPRKLPRGVKDEGHLKKILSMPVTSTFTDQHSLRKKIRSKIVTRMGARIEPINKRVVACSRNKANWT